MIGIRLNHKNVSQTIRRRVGRQNWISTTRDFHYIQEQTVDWSAFWNVQHSKLMWNAKYRQPFHSYVTTSNRINLAKNDVSHNSFQSIDWMQLNRSSQPASESTATTRARVQFQLEIIQRIGHRSCENLGKICINLRRICSTSLVKLDGNVIDVC